MPAAGFQARPDSTARHRLINYHREDQMPTSARLTELVEATLRRWSRHPESSDGRPTCVAQAMRAPNVAYDSCSYLKDSWIFVR
jgi:hypothetical protein